MGIFYHSIDPVALYVGGLPIRWYALSYIFSIIIGWQYCLRITKRVPSVTPVTAPIIDELMTWFVFGVLIGGRLGYVLFYNIQYYCEHPLEILMVWKRGMSFHGGLIGVCVSIYVFSKRKGLKFLDISDLLSIVTPIGLFFGRIANFINGELYGKITSVPWAMIFPGGGHVPRHPSQIYEAFFEGVVLFIILQVALTRKQLQKKGCLTGIFLLGYAVARSLGEIFREPEPHISDFLGIISYGQLLSFPMLIAGVYLIFSSRRKPTT